MKNTVNWLIALLILFIAYNATMIGANFIPWYTQEQPVKVEKQTYSPGDSVRLIVDRHALVNLTARVTAELIRIDGEVEVEVYKRSWQIVMGKGKKKFKVDYLLPTINECPWLGTNTFVWKGAIVYNPPLGLPERLVYFRSEKFHIRGSDA